MGRVNTVKPVWGKRNNSTILQLKMRLLFISLASIALFISCQNKVDTATLDKAFISSFKDGKFTMLEEFLPTKAFYKSMGKEMAERSDEEIDSFLNRSNKRLMDNWDVINQAIKEKQVDPAKINIKETIVYNPFRESSVQAMVIVYEYNNKTWDDLSLIVKQMGDTTYLLEIPNPRRAFSFSDTSLTESSQARSAIEMEKPEFQKVLQQQVKQLIDLAKDDNLNEFGNHVIYNGDDKSRSWKSAVNMADSSEKELAVHMMQAVKKATKDCSSFSFDKLESERESEGYWIVQAVNCDKKIIRFAFLKVNGKMLLGSIDAESLE